MPDEVEDSDLTGILDQLCFVYPETGQGWFSSEMLLRFGKRALEYPRTKTRNIGYGATWRSNSARLRWRTRTGSTDPCKVESVEDVYLTDLSASTTLESLIGILNLFEQVDPALESSGEYRAAAYALIWDKDWPADVLNALFSWPTSKLTAMPFSKSFFLTPPLSVVMLSEIFAGIGGVTLNEEDLKDLEDRQDRQALNQWHATELVEAVE